MSGPLATKARDGKYYFEKKKEYDDLQNVGHNIIESRFANELSSKYDISTFVLVLDLKSKIYEDILSLNSDIFMSLVKDVPKKRDFIILHQHWLLFL